MEKRALTRIVMSLAAECSAPGMGVCKIHIRDFCLGGFAVAYDNSYSSNPAQNIRFTNDLIVDLRCTIPSATGQKIVQIQGRVVRADEVGAGIAFINPNPDTLHLLHDYAVSSKLTSPQPAAAQPPSHTKSQQHAKENNRTLQLACVQLAEKSISLIFNAFLEQVTKRLVAEASEIRNIENKKSYLNALTEYKTQATPLKNEFTSKITLQLSAFASPTIQPAIKPKQDFSLSPLSLIEEDEFEEWLAYSETSRKLENTFQQKINELNRRLDLLTTEPLDRENSPFAPAAFAKSFQHALGAISLDNKSLQISHMAIREVLTDLLGDMYDHINQYLNDAGVAASIKLPVNPKTKLQTQTNLAPQISTVTPSSLPDNATTQPSQAVFKSDATFTSLQQIDKRSPQHNPPPHDWYSLVQFLGGLQQQTQQQIGYRPHGTTAGQPLNSAANMQMGGEIQFYSPDELLSALSNIRFPEQPHPEAVNDRQDIKSQLMSTLALEKAVGEYKQLSGREEAILEIAGNLFESMLSDERVAKNVRPWLQQLSVPMMKMALQDDTLFSDKSHLARQVINSLAQLELYGDENTDMGLNAIRKRINQLISEVTSANEVTPQLFEKMLKDLKILIRLQDKAYQENMADVYAACEDEQRVARIANKTPADLSNLNHIDDPDALYQIEESLDEWITKITRLKIGDWLSFKQDDNSQHLRLAWIADQSKHFVFVNAKGLKKLELGQLALTKQLRDATAVVLDNGDEPLIDRAQSAMLQKIHQQLLHASSHDKLTGLINRTEFEKLLSKALISSKQSNLHHVICYIDLDQFSVVNNTFGYSGGDQLLTEVTELLKNEVRDHGIIARIGGDEFGILLENCTLENALEIITRQKLAIQRYRLTHEQKSLGISFSAGLVTIEPESESVTILLQDAEASCRIARHKGTNYIQVYSPDDKEMSRQHQAVSWVAKIDEALDNNSLVLRYQTISRISSTNNTPFHAEILLGIPDEEGNLISPTDFIFAAESFRRMVAVDRWVIENVFRWMETHEQELNAMGGLAINLSGASLNEEGFIDFILQQAQIFNVPMHKICFEVTETAGIASLSNASEFILEIKKTGCTFALDDFGSGLSSYAYLQNLPVDYLKIDGAFVKHMDSNPYDYAVAKSITEIGHFMGKGIIAEHVENQSILDMLMEMGVDYAQGYVVAKPLPLI